MTLLTYSHPGLSKADFLAELQRHRDADRLVQGTYYENGDGWRGCAIGCSLESVRRRLELPEIAHHDHAEYERYLGIPRVLARLEDRIFESLPLDEAVDWPIQFSTAIPIGADLSGVWNRFAPWVLREIALPAVTKDEWGVRSVLERVILGYETGWIDERPEDVRLAATNAATAATNAANAAAYAAATNAAAYAAATNAAAYAANAAAYAANAAAYVAITYATTYAVDAIYVAAYATAYAAYAISYATEAANATAATLFTSWRRMADKLCELMAETPAP